MSARILAGLAWGGSGPPQRPPNREERLGGVRSLS